MAGNGEAFAKGGCGCLILFAIITVGAMVIGGSAHIDLGGAIILFIIGGLIGLIINAIYKKGQQDAQNDAHRQ